MKKASNARYDSLSAVLEEIGNKGAMGAVVAGVVLTYEFDPDFVRTLAYQGLLAYDANAECDEPLRWAGAFPVALFFDPKRARSLGRTPGNFEIHFAAREGWGAHHPKAYALALRDGGFELVLGSFNLTSSGVYENRELLLRFSLPGEKDGEPDVEALRMHLAWRDFLKSTYRATTHSPALDDYLKRLDARLDAFESELALNDNVSSLRFVSSGYPVFPNGFETLREYAADLDLKPTRLLVISPFFDDPKRHGNGALERFFDREDGFPTLERVSLFSSQKCWNPSYFKKVERLASNPEQVRCFQIPKDISHSEAEALDKHFGQGEGGIRNALKKRQLTRELHAKAVVLVDENGLGLLYAGSANFSAKAWFGDNAEMGVAGKIFLGALGEDWDKNLVKALLGVCPEKVPLQDDAPLPEPDPDDEDGAIQALPKWLESVTLAKVDVLDANASGMSQKSGDCGEAPPFARFLYRVHRESWGDAREAIGRFKAGEIDVTPNKSVGVQDANGTPEALASDPLTLHQVELVLRSTRSLAWLPTGAEAEDVRPIPFNVDPTVGVRAEWAASVTVDVSEALTFLRALLEGERPRVRTDPTDGSGTETDLPDNPRDGKIATDDVMRPSLTHVMREWISHLDRLESALFDEKGRAIGVRSDFYIYLSEYARRLAAPRPRIADHSIAGVPQRFALAELLGVVSRYALATVHDSGCERGIEPEDAARICDIREHLMTLCKDDSTDCERNVIEGYFARIDRLLLRAGVIGGTTDA